MNKKIISLCMILFILIICTTVSAEEITNDTTTHITSNIPQTTSTHHTEITKDESYSSSEINVDSMKIQDVQKTDEKRIIKQNNSTNNVKTEDNPTSVNYNLTGLVTVAYNKENETYALSEVEGFPVSGAKVRLYNEKTGKILNTLSNAEGRYEFQKLEAGKYTIEFEYGTYAKGVESITINNETQPFDYIFVPDIAIIAFSGDNSGSGQSEKINYLKKLSDRFLFLESYELNSSYDKSGQWMIDYSRFILVDMFSVGNGFGVNVDLIRDSPASRNKKIAYCFGVFDDAILKGTLGNWGWLGDNPHSIENTYVGSYWQALSETNSTPLQTNMKNLFKYIQYLLGETTVNPTQNGNGPVLLSNSWGLYYPGYHGNVKTPSNDLIKTWIESNPGYNADNSGSLNWMTENYSQWNLENNDPVKILRDFEDWYTTKKKLNGSFVVISTYYEGGKVVDALIDEFEKQGRAVFSIYKSTSEDPDMTALLELAGNKTVITRGVAAVSYMYWWTTGYAQRGGNYTINAYKNLNVSLINALKDISKFSFESEYGPQNEWTAAVTMPQFEGVFGALPVSYLDEEKETVIIPEGVAKHVQLTNGWAKLRELNNSDKKVAILLYDYPPGKANIGASYLDVFQSLHDMLEHLSDAGYDIGMNKSQIPTTEELSNIVSDFGNKGQWAEGLLDSYVIENYDDLIAHGQLVSKKSYMQWYNALPEVLQEDLTRSWGEGLGNGSMIYRETVEVSFKDFKNWISLLSDDVQDMFKHYWDISNKTIVISKNRNSIVLNKTAFYQWLYDLPSNLQSEFDRTAGYGILNDSKYRNEGYFLIPGMFFGNIFVSVQPVRGWESQEDFHHSDLAPPQQYIAYYKYLSKIVGINAVIHMGTHGTLEWLPGRSLGLQSTDWTFQLTDTPIIYPYIVSNPGEGMTAKERSFAQVLTHMTPVISSSSIYGQFIELNDAIARYESNKNTGAEDNVLYYRNSILEITSDLGYDDPDYVVVMNYLNDYQIALNNNDTESIEKARKNLILKAKILGVNEPSEDEFETWLNDLEELLNSQEVFEEWLEEIQEDIEAMSVDKVTSGMHTLGYVWDDTEMITGVSFIASSRTTVLEDIMNLYYPEIQGSYYDKIKDRNFGEEKEVIDGVLTTMVTNLVNGESVEEVANSYGVFNTSSPIYLDLLDINGLIEDIRNNKEWEYILTALGGGYVEPGLSADPAYSDVLPTGGSMYSSDATKMPSKGAWQSAVNSINQLLTKYMINLGEESYPEVVGEVIWGTEVLRTEGISLAQFMYLLGVKPTWDRTGKVNGSEIIPLDELTITIDGMIYNRPRIDVFTTIVSNNPDWIGLLTDAVVKVNNLNETFEENFVKKHYYELVKNYNLTHEQALERLFGLPGAILEGTGVSDLLNKVSTTLNESSGIAEELASVYETRISHSWNVDDDGNIVVKDNGKIFTYLLEHVSLIIQNLDSTWRYLDSDDYADWFGGLLNAANVHGATPNTILLDIRDKNNVVTNTLGEEVKRETRTTLLNPQWLNDITVSVGGWNQMSMNFENLMKTMLTTQNYKENQAGKAILDTSGGNNAGIVGDGLLRQLAETVTYSEYFNIDAQYKSYAFQSMAGWLLTSDMAQYWKTSDNTLRKDLLQKYVDNANRYGVACCHHTCGNINFHEWVIKVGSSLGVKGLSEYSQVYASATQNPNAVYDASSQAASNADGTGTGPNSGTGTGTSSGTVDINEGIGEYINNGATSEINAMGSATAGAASLTDEYNDNINSMTMASPNNRGSSDSGNSAGTGGMGTNTGTGEGNDNQASGSGSGTGSGSGKSNTDSKTNTNPEKQTDSKTNTNPEKQTDSNKQSEDKPVQPSPNNKPEENKNQPNNSGNQQSETQQDNTGESKQNTESNSNSTKTSDTPTVPEKTRNNTSSNEENKQNNTIINTDDSGAGETPTTETSEASESTEAANSNGDSTSYTVNTVEGSSAGGEAGATTTSVSVYELIEKNIGTPPSPQSEIAIGYLAFIVFLLIIFFIGFTRPNARDK